MKKITKILLVIAGIALIIVAVFLLRDRMSPKLISSPMKVNLTPVRSSVQTVRKFLLTMN